MNEHSVTMDPDEENDGDYYYYLSQLTELFNGTHITLQTIDNAIERTLADRFDCSREENLEDMINLLLIPGDGAVTDTANTYQQHLDQLLSLFPDICPIYLRQITDQYQPFDFDAVVEQLSSCDYITNVKDPSEVWEHLKEILPHVDPSYLYDKASYLCNRPQIELDAFMHEALEREDLPTLKDYLKNKHDIDELSIYTTQFTVDAYLECIPNPLEFFANPERTPSLNQKDVDQNDIDCALIALFNHFSFIHQNNIKRIFKNTKNNLIETSSKLKVFPRNFQKPRRPIPEQTTKNKALLQELAFVKYEKQIKHFIKQKNENYRRAFQEAKTCGLLQICNCCFDDQLLPDECYFCNKNCTFCKDCVKTGAEQVIGKMQTVFPCLNDCDSEFSYQTLHMVLDKKSFNRLCRRKQMEEIKNANIDGLETCPFCDFSMIPLENDKIFRCENFECGIESCRECRHESHVPLKCSEVEYDEDVKMRTYIEDKMTEALLRTCWKCAKKFYKESGCNKMTCVCGAKMCYLCGARILSNDYSHFSPSNSRSSDERCPVYTNDLEALHKTRVLQGAQTAKKELGIDQNPKKLKFDPTSNLA